MTSGIQLYIANTKLAAAIVGGLGLAVYVTYINHNKTYMALKKFNKNAQERDEALRKFLGRNKEDLYARMTEKEMRILEALKGLKLP